MRQPMAIVYLQWNIGSSFTHTTSIASLCQSASFVSIEAPNLEYKQIHKDKNSQQIQTDIY